MQDPSTIMVQTPIINQGPNSTNYFPTIHHLSTTLCIIFTYLIYPKSHPKYLNSDICSNRILSTRNSHSSNTNSPPNTITLLLHWLSDLFSYTPQQNVQPLALGALPTRHIKSSYMHTRGQVIFILSLPLNISFSSSPYLFSPPSYI